MSVTIGKYTFDGPFKSTDELEDRPGIYAILCQGRGKSLLIDVGESAKVKMTVGNHGREDCWKKNCHGTLVAAVYYASDLKQDERIAIEQEIRSHYDVPCGPEQ